MYACSYGRLAEWSIAHRWKRCVPQGTGGSNPPSSESTMISYYVTIEKKSRMALFWCTLSFYLVFARL